MWLETVQLFLHKSKETHEKVEAKTERGWGEREETNSQMNFGDKFLLAMEEED